MKINNRIKTLIDLLDDELNKQYYAIETVYPEDDSADARAAYNVNAYMVERVRELYTLAGLEVEALENYIDEIDEDHLDDLKEELDRAQMNYEEAYRIASSS